MVEFSKMIEKRVKTPKATQIQATMLFLTLLGLRTKEPMLWEQGVGGSNPLTPTRENTTCL